MMLQRGDVGDVIHSIRQTRYALTSSLGRVSTTIAQLRIGQLVFPLGPSDTCVMSLGHL